MYISNRKENDSILEQLDDEIYNFNASIDKQKMFEHLCFSKLKDYYPSERCKGKRCVIGKSCGNLDAKIMFIAEAPGRNGAERTGVPIYGDPTGDNFEKILFQSTNGILTRKDIYITNVFLWNPTNSLGNNDKPTEEEIKKSICFLQEQIEIVNPELIIVLGMTAYNSLNYISKIPIEGCSMGSLSGKLLEWNNKLLGVMYHPSQIGRASCRERV